MEEPSFMEDEEGVELYKNAKDHFAKGEYIKALVIIEDLLSVHGEDKNAWSLRNEQGEIFLKMAETTENPDLKFVYWLGSVECYYEERLLSPICAYRLRDLAQHIGSVLYFKKCVEKAREGMFVNTEAKAKLSLEEENLMYRKNKDLQSLIKDAVSKIDVSKTSSLTKNCESIVWGSKKGPEPLVTDKIRRLKSYWMGLDVEVKRDFMKVSIAELTNFVEGVHSREGRDALDELIASAKKDMKWTFWMCRTMCLKNFSSAEKCKNHLEQQHAADFKPCLDKHMVQRIGKDWARKILVGVWEPVDAVAAAEMIKNQLADVKAFASKSKNGWSKEWPLAADKERKMLLKELKTLLLLLSDQKILSGSIRDWVMHFPAGHLGKLAVSRQSLNDSRLMETPQSICFLECHELSQIRDFLKTIKCERNDGTDLVCRTVEVFLGRTRVKEKIDFDTEFSFLLLDRRLLKSSNVPFDDDVKINVFDPNSHYAKAHAQGDDIISWLADYNSVDKTFPIPVREHNLGIWVAVLRAVQFTCRALRAKYAKKAQVLEYDAALTVVKNLCMSEDKRRRNLPEDKWIKYASLLCDEMDQSVPEDSPSTNLFLCVVRDVFEGALHPRFYILDVKDCLNLIRGSKCLLDDIVLESIDHLKSVVTHKVMLVDSKILLIDNSRISLLNNLTRLSSFDNRTYILRLLKTFLLSELMNMESKDAVIKSDAAKEDLLLEEEKKSQSKKKNNKNKNKKKTPSSISVENKPSAHLDPEDTSQLQKMVEQASIEPDGTLASESDRLKISSNTDNQEEAAKFDHDLQKLPEEESLPGHLVSALGEVAVRYNSALDMTLKALINITTLKEDLMQNRQPFQDHRNEHVPSALKNFFTAFVSKVIKNEGVYSCLLSDLLAYLEEVPSMSSDAANVVVAILEFWHCWKSPERESLVTRLFTLEENERVSCRKCRRIPNNPEQSSYGIVMAADSIRGLSCAFESMKFVDILKMIRMEYKLLCDKKTGGCGKTNIFHHIISRRPPIFTIVLEWEKSETGEEITKTAKALDWQIDLSKLYEGLKANSNYRLVSMVGCGGVDEAHICLAYEKNRMLVTGVVWSDTVEKRRFGQRFCFMKLSDQWPSKV